MCLPIRTPHFTHLFGYHLLSIYYMLVYKSVRKKTSKNSVLLCSTQYIGSSLFYGTKITLRQHESIFTMLFHNPSPGSRPSWSAQHCCFLAFLNQEGPSLPVALCSLIFMVFLQLEVISLFGSCQSSYLKSWEHSCFICICSDAVLNALLSLAYFSVPTFYNFVKTYSTNRSWNAVIAN